VAALSVRVGPTFTGHVAFFSADFAFSRISPRTAAFLIRVTRRFRIPSESFTSHRVIESGSRSDPEILGQKKLRDHPLERLASVASIFVSRLVKSSGQYQKIDPARVGTAGAEIERGDVTFPRINSLPRSDDRKNPASGAGDPVTGYDRSNRRATPVPPVIRDLSSE